MKAIGLESAMIMDYHGDGHPRDRGQIRLQELNDYFRACRAQSDKDYLLIPAEEANVILGGHWALVFPKPVYWHMDRQLDQPFIAPDQPFINNDPKYATVSHTANPRASTAMH